jgi:hypothetical protein
MNRLTTPRGNLGGGAIVDEVGPPAAGFTEQSAGRAL